MRQFRPILLLTSAVAACGEPLGPIAGLPRELSVAEQHLVQSDNRFAFKLFREVHTQDTSGGNIIISPLSVAMALGMAYNGAAGDTRTAMERTLELEGLTLPDVNESYRSLIDLLRTLDPRVDFQVANSLWSDLDIEILPAFLDVIRRYFDAEAASLDFRSPAAVEQINRWVENNTRGKIDRILEEIPGNVIAYLINAIYYKGQWTYQFDKGRTRDEPFTLADGSQMPVPMMSHEGGVRIRHAMADGVAIVDLPYGGDAFSMTIALPQRPEDIAALVEDLSHERWNTWIDLLQADSVFISMPRFTLEYEIRLNDVLKALGMEIAFDLGAADFSNLFVNAGAAIDEVKHKTFVEVNEEGTEAAAVTVVSFLDSTAGPPRIVVDRPFLFAIRERHSGTVLFLGLIMNPAA